jgi:uncharacterized protein YjbI with pentapeptide repeats
MSVSTNSLAHANNGTDILVAHDIWVQTDGKCGEQLNHEIVDCSLLDFKGQNLRQAQLRAVNLRGKNLTDADFSEANLRCADLSGAKLQNVNFTNTDLRDAILQDTDLTLTRGLIETQLGGTNLLRAKLPTDVEKFKALETVEELSKNASTLFFSIIVTSAFILLTIARTEDTQLLTNAGSAKLPLLDIDIPLNWFYTIAPLILLCLYTYFHLYLLRLWETLATLPAIFPNGRRQDEQTYPWLLNDLISSYLPNLRHRRPRLYNLQRVMYIFLAWWLIPLLILPFWARYLTRHYWPTTMLHVTLLVLSIAIGQLFYRLAKATFQKGRENTPSKRKPGNLRTIGWHVIFIAFLFAFFAILSYGAINGVPEDRVRGDEARFFIGVPKALRYIGIQPFADFRKVDVSTRPSKWTGRDEDIESVQGAYLQGSNLRYADGWRAFLVKADLRNANLEKAILVRADLRMAELLEANLQYCMLGFADLRNADLYRTKLTNAGLEYVNLKGAKLNEANLNGTDLNHANLEETDLRKADLRNANLEGAVLTGAIYDIETMWGNFDPTKGGAKLVPSDDHHLKIR